MTCFCLDVAPYKNDCHEWKFPFVFTFLAWRESSHRNEPLLIVSTGTPVDTMDLMALRRRRRRRRRSV